MVVITCAGLGSRFKGYINYPKQLLPLKNEYIYKGDFKISF